MDQAPVEPRFWMKNISRSERVQAEEVDLPESIHGSDRDGSPWHA